MLAKMKSDVLGIENIEDANASAYFAEIGLIRADSNSNYSTKELQRVVDLINARVRLASAGTLDKFEEEIIKMMNLKGISVKGLSKAQTSDAVYEMFKAKTESTDLSTVKKVDDLFKTANTERSTTITSLNEAIRNKTASTVVGELEKISEEYKNHDNQVLKSDVAARIIENAPINSDGTYKGYNFVNYAQVRTLLAEYNIK